jgi:HEAT repeat protein
VNARGIILMQFAALAPVAGCPPADAVVGLPRRADLERRALRLLAQAVVQREPAAQVRAIEALERAAPEQGRAYFNELLFDESPAVRFAALMALGGLKRGESVDRVRALAGDPDGSVRAAAVFALHRLGDRSRTSELSPLLLDHPSAGARANAAMVLGRLGERGAATLLHAALRREKDESVRLQALEALAALGDRKATGQLGLMAMNSTGQKMVFALLALRRPPRRELRALFAEQLAAGPYDEVRLAAAVGLAGLSDRSGFDFALDRLSRFAPSRSGVDPPDQQAARVKTLAALALEQMGDPRALDALAAAMNADPDPTVRIAAARAVLSIIRREPLGN